MTAIASSAHSIDLVLEEIFSDTFEEGPALLRFTIDEAGEFVVDVVDVVEEEAESAAEEAEEATEERSEENSGKMNDETGWIEDNPWIAAVGGALGLGAVYRILAHRLGDEGDT